MNQNLNEKQASFQFNNIPNRLGHIATNLARIKSFSQIAYKEAVKSVISETKLFIEWTAAEIEPVQAEELVNIQVQLAMWELTWSDIWADEKLRAEVAEQSGIWSEQVLDMSGLLSESIA
ncbi:MAG: hypothetical protein HEQ29_12820 [Dolichospermum sp. LBC05a]|nr:hypothetical protein [Dolichospermum sp. OL01]MCO5797618.1 hypothetical protein [Dolichospermum sp. OL03]MCS6280394.1 hypothetical protein [Dolichospermum sp.]QSV59131.1 MAG: hypothetical protein HEQ29_12820 [Dolichospermum sp. LBC05a]